jgi:F-type H+-transporting ATPase subunit delta
MIVLGGSSRQSLVALRGSLDSKLNGASASDCSAISSDLFKVLDALDSSVGLRRALTDPARDASSKSALIADLFGKSIGSAALALVGNAVALRWSSSVEFADAVEQIAVEAQAAAANVLNELDQMQREIFTFSQLLVENPELRQALNTTADSMAHKQALLKDIFGSKFSAGSSSLLNQTVSTRRSRNIERTVVAYSHAVTARRNRVNAHVRTSIALTEAQTKKLVDSLTKQIGQSVHLNIEIDPTVIGGIAIRFGDEVIDGTISNRLAEASRVLVS